MADNDWFLVVLRYYGGAENWDEYLSFTYAGSPPVDENGNLPAELEAELPWKFQRAALAENVITEEKQ